MKNDTITIDIMQNYISNGLLLHPLLQETYEKKLQELERMSKISFLPITKLNFYNKKIRQKIAC